jgi:hypothetical protein
MVSLKIILSMFDYNSIDETVRNPQSEKPGAPSQGVGLGQGGGRGAANTRSMVRHTNMTYIRSSYSLI